MRIVAGFPGALKVALRAVVVAHVDQVATDGGGHVAVHDQ